MPVFKSKHVWIALVTSAALWAPSTAFAEWAGPYGGIALTYGSGEAEDLSFGSGPFDIDGTQVALFGGYNWQSGSFVYGGELSLSMGDVKGSDGAFMLPLKMGKTAMLKARFGYDGGAYLPYGFIGAASSDFEADHDGSGTNMASSRFSGFAYGIGLDYAINDKSFVRAEVSRVNYNVDVLTFGAADSHSLDDIGVTVLSIGFGMRF